MPESAKGSLVIHLGMPRTGVRALQSFCLLNRNRFEVAGWHVVESQMEPSSTSIDGLINASLKRAFRPGNPDKAQGHLEVLARHLKDVTAQQVLLWRPWPTEAEAGIWHALHRAVKDSGRTLRLTAYIREQRSWLLSSYAERVMHRQMAATASRFVQKSRDSGALDYLGLHRMLADGDDKAHVEFRPFEPARFIANDVRHDFLGLLGIPATDMDFAESRRDSSPGAVALELMRQLNALEDASADDPQLLIRVAQEAGLNGDSALWRLVPPAQLDAVASSFRNANAALAGRLFGDSSVALFNDAPPDQYEPFGTDELINARSIELLVRYQKAHSDAASRKAAPMSEEEPAADRPADTVKAAASITIAIDRPVALYRVPFLRQGVHEIGDGLACEVLEERSIKRHEHIRGSYPAGYPIESQFECGPVLAFKATSGFTDAQAGITITATGNPVRESVVVERLIEGYAAQYGGSGLPVGADSVGSILLPLATQRKENYCRWWLDSISKIFVASRSTLLGEDWQRGNVRVVAPVPTTRFHRQTLELLRSNLHCPWQDIEPAAPLLAATAAANSPGITFGGGQHLGALVCDYARFIQDLLLRAPEAETPSSGGELLYISRNDSDMRRIVNEDELLPGLEQLGFGVMMPSKLPLPTQMAAFNKARVIVSAHGAALTNLLFCRPGTTVIEIFPEGGVHGSAFLRIASHRDFNYFFIVGRAVANRQSQKNPNNANIVLDVAESLALIRDAVESQRS